MVLRANRSIFELTKSSIPGWGGGGFGIWTAEFLLPSKILNIEKMLTQLSIHKIGY